MFLKLNCMEGTSSLFISFLPEYRNVKFAFKRVCVMNSAVQSLGTVNDWSSHADLLILGCCTVSLDLYLKSRRALLSQNCRFQRVSAKPWGKQICSCSVHKVGSFRREPTVLPVVEIHEAEGKLMQEAILEAKPRYLSDLTEELFCRFF